jgi:hypothetical protein
VRRLIAYLVALYGSKGRERRAYSALAHACVRDDHVDPSVRG